MHMNSNELFCVCAKTLHYNVAEQDRITIFVKARSIPKMPPHALCLNGRTVTDSCILSVRVCVIMKAGLLLYP